MGRLTQGSPDRVTGGSGGGMSISNQKNGNHSRMLKKGTVEPDAYYVIATGRMRETKGRFCQWEASRRLDGSGKGESVSSLYFAQTSALSSKQQYRAAP